MSRYQVCMNDSDWTRKRFRGWAQGCSLMAVGVLGFIGVLALV